MALEKVTINRMYLAEGQVPGIYKKYIFLATEYQCYSRI